MGDADFRIALLFAAMKVNRLSLLCAAALLVVIAEIRAADTPPAKTPETAMAVRFELFVKNCRASVDFYTRVLGFSTDSTSDTYAPIRNGSVQIGIVLQGTLPKTHHFSPQNLQGPKGVGTEIVLEVDNFDAFYQHVLSSGYPVGEEVALRLWGLRDFRLVDPDGYYLRITEKKPRAQPAGALAPP